MFSKKSKKAYKQVLTGVYMKTVVYGEKTLMTKFFIKKGSRIPVHSHPHEQTGYMVSGALQFILGDKEYEARPGDSWCILPDVKHGAYCRKESVVIEVFSPLREEYLP